MRKLIHVWHEMSGLDQEWPVMTPSAFGWSVAQQVHAVGRPHLILVMFHLKEGLH